MGSGRGYEGGRGQGGDGKGYAERGEGCRGASWWGCELFRCAFLLFSPFSSPLTPSLLTDMHPPPLPRISPPSPTSPTPSTSRTLTSFRIISRRPLLPLPLHHLWQPRLGRNVDRELSDQRDRGALKAELCSLGRLSIVNEKEYGEGAAKENCSRSPALLSLPLLLFPLPCSATAPCCALTAWRNSQGTVTASASPPSSSSHCSSGSSPAVITFHCSASLTAVLLSASTSVLLLAHPRSLSSPPPFRRCPPIPPPHQLPLQQSSTTPPLSSSSPVRGRTTSAQRGRTTRVSGAEGRLRVVVGAIIRRRVR